MCVSLCCGGLDMCMVYMSVCMRACVRVSTCVSMCVDDGTIPNLHFTHLDDKLGQ